MLKDLSLTIEPGQLAALVGPTGAGKTTIISLIPRFYDPISGVIKIDGTDIKQFKQKSLRQQISFVLQETVLFQAPIWQNIAYGKPEASSGRNTPRGRAGQRPGIHREDAGRLRHHAGRARHDAFGRSAPAHRDCPRHHSRHPNPHSR